MLDLRPIATPQNPFSWMAKALRDADYPTTELAEKAADSAEYMDSLAESLPDIRSQNPVFLVAVCQAAQDGKNRADLLAALQDVDRLIESQRGKA
jgi:hypothetical protein